MPETTPPALTPEEWRDWINADDANGLGHGVYRLHHQPDTTEHTVLRYVNGITLDGGNDCGEPISPEEQDRHALAALCLYDQPYGFTHDDVQLLRDIVAACARADESQDYYTGGMVDTHEIGDVTGLADRLAALLPPRP